MTEPDACVVEVTTATTSQAVNRAAAAAGRADIVLLAAGAAVPDGALAQLAELGQDGTVATVCAMPASAGAQPAAGDRRAATVATAGGPCVLLRRSALDLAGALDEQLPLHEALAAFCDRCTSRGAIHLLALDVVVGDAEGATPPRPAGSVSEDPAARALAGAPVSRPSVTVDVRALGGSYVAGTQVHALELVRALARTQALDLRLLLPPDLDAEAIAATDGLAGVATVRYEDVAAGRAAPSDLVHRPQQVYTPDDLRLLQLAAHRIVVTHQDAILYRNPWYFETTEAWAAYRRTTRLALGTADAVVFFSAHARDDALRDALVGPDRAEVVAPGVDHLSDTGDGAAPAEIADVPVDRGLVCLGTDLRHKNRPFVLRLAAALRDRHGWDGPIVFAGPHADRGGSADEEAEILRSDPELALRVHDVGAVSDGERAWLLRTCAAVAYPSVVEGFGLVPFEAALAGTPCLLAPQGPLAELLGASAALVPWDAAASADRVIELLRDGSARDANVADIAAVARRHTWDACAGRLVEVYQRALSTSTRAAAVVGADAVATQEALRHAQAEVTRLTLELGALAAQIGPHTLGLAGTGGALPPDVQDALTALAAHPRLRDAAFAALRSGHRAVRRGR